MCRKYIKFCSRNLGNSRENKNVRRWTTFGLETEKSSILAKSIGKINFTWLDKIVLLTGFS